MCIKLNWFEFGAGFGFMLVVGFAGCLVGFRVVVCLFVVFAACFGLLCFGLV